MFVIIPHPTEELKLINFQKELIKKNNAENTILYTCQPLWCEIPEFFNENCKNSDFKNSDCKSGDFKSGDFKTELKKFSKTIKEIIIKNTDYNDDDKEIFLPVEIITQTITIKSKIPLLRIYKGQIPQNLKNQKSPMEKLKIFRIAKSALYSENQKSLQDFIWCKLKN